MRRRNESYYFTSASVDGNGMFDCAVCKCACMFSRTVVKAVQLATDVGEIALLNTAGAEMCF